MSFFFGKKKGGHNNSNSTTNAAAPPPGAREATASPTGSQPSINASLNSLQGAGSPDPKSPLAQAVAAHPTAARHAQQPSDASGSGGASPQQMRIPPQKQQNQQFPAPAGAPPPNSNLYPWSQRRLTLTERNESPFPRYGHASNAVASKDGNVYIMGGLIGSQTVRGDLWIIEGQSDRLVGYPLFTTSEGPGPRVGHASLLVGNAFIVFGGDTKLDEGDVLDETLYLLNTATKQWSRANPLGPRPSGRYGHTLNILGSKLYIFGGQVDTVFFNDLVAFDLNQLQHPGSKWEVLMPVTEGSTAFPAPRTNHTIVTWNDKLFLFGGTNGTEWFNDVWSYDPRANQWTQLDCIGFIPSPREGHAASLVGDVMYVFGGRSADSVDLGDLAAFRISSRRWYTFQNMGPSPSPRSGHTMSTIGQKIVVLGGEPSLPSRQPEELQLIYVLDTSKIKYPNDNPMSPAAERVPGQRRMTQTGKPPSIDNTVVAAKQQPANKAPRESMMGSSPPAQSPLAANNTSGGQANSRLPRSSVGMAPGPPPAQQAPTPKTNGVTQGGRKTPTTPAANKSMSPIAERGSVTPTAAAASAAPGRRTPSAQQRKVSETGIPTSRSNSRQQQTRHEKTASVGSNDAGTSPVRGPVSRRSSFSQGSGGVPVRKPSIEQRINEEPREVRGPAKTNAPQAQPPVAAAATPPAPSPAPTPASAPSDTTLTPASRGLSEDPDVKEELEQLRQQNNWYVSELSLARRAGYTPQNSTNILLDERGSESLSDADRPLVEALLTLRGELAKVQSEVDTRGAEASKRITDVERQRDVAISEAVYAKAKLAALGGTMTPTPGEKGSDMAAMDAEKMQDMSRKLAASLAAQADLSARVEVLVQEITAERKGRHLADETAAAAQTRIAELDEYRNRAASEIESLRAELLDAGKAFRDEAATGQEAVSEVKLLRIDNSEMKERLEEALSDNEHYRTSMEQLRGAMFAGNAKGDTLGRQLEDERLLKEGLERKMGQLRSEYEEKASDLESVNSRLKDMEELVERYADEAKAANAALASGMDRIAEREGDRARSNTADDRVHVLQEQLEGTKALLVKSQAQADEAGERLGEAMQRVAGLEFQQGQASKDAIALRRRMAETLDEVRRLKSENAELTNRLNDKQLEVDAVSTKHAALKEILNERSASQAVDKRRSQLMQSPSPHSGTATPEQLGRLRELEHRLEESLKAHRETKNSAEMQAQEIEKHFREKLEQLENDYQSAVHYVKGTEKMLKRMKDELSKHKALNARLQIEVEEAQRKSEEHSRREGDRSELEADWENERDLLNQEIDDLRSKVRESATALDKQIRETKAQLDALREERDDYKLQHNQLQVQALDSSKELSTAKQLLEKLEGENSLLEQRAQGAEQKVAMLLDQVESSVDSYRRTSRLEGANGDATSARSSFYSPAGGFGPGVSLNDGNNRNSMALDMLASELETLKSDWETRNKTYRLSNTFDFEKTGHDGDDDPEPPSASGLLPGDVAQWRMKLHEEEKNGRRSAQESVVSKSSLGKEGERREQASPVSPISPVNGSTPTPTAAAASGGMI